MNRQTTRRYKRWWYVLSLLIIVAAGLFIVRYELVFAYQRMRLGQLPAREKLWVHRVNSLERFNIMKDHFGGMETDVVFDTAIKKFRVYHPPAKPTSLKLEKYLKWLKPLNKHLWIDVKDIDTAYYADAITYFMEYDSQYDFKSRIIIESTQTRFINMLAERGFITSFLVPDNFLQPGTPQALIDSVKQQLLPGVRFVSQEDHFLPLLRSRFPERKIITWALSFNNYYDLSHLRSLIADTSISVVLIQCKSKGNL